MLSDRPDAVPLTSDPAHQAHMPEVIGFLLKSQFQSREHVVAGGLMPYGVSLSDLFRMGAVCTEQDSTQHQTCRLCPLYNRWHSNSLSTSRLQKPSALRFPQWSSRKADKVIE
jgi:hypothetical protein